MIYIIFRLKSMCLGPWTWLRTNHPQTSDEVKYKIEKSYETICNLVVE